MINWHALITKYGKEDEVNNACATLELDSCCPKYLIKWASKGRIHTRNIPLIPRYVFVKFDIEDVYQWRSVFDIEDVSKILGGERPGIVKEEELERLCGYVINDGELNLTAKAAFANFWAGDIVRLLGGPFAGYEVECTWTDGKLAAVKIPLLGVEAPLYYPAELCDPVVKLTRLMAAPTVRAESPGKKRRGKRRQGGKSAKVVRA